MKSVLTLATCAAFFACWLSEDVSAQENFAEKIFEDIRKKRAYNKFRKIDGKVIGSNTQEADVKIQSLSSPSDPNVFPSDVYGHVLVELEQWKKGEDDYKSVLRRALSAIFKKKQGKFSIFIEVLKGDQILARAPIISVTATRTSLFTLTTNQTYVRNTNWTQDLIRDLPLGNDFNRLQVRIVYYNTTKIGFDIAEATPLVQLENQANLALIKAAGAAAVNPYLGVWEAVKKSLSAVMKYDNSTTLSDAVTMSFVKTELEAPNTIRFRLKARGGRFADFYVRFVTTSSRFGKFNPSAKMKCFYGANKSAFLRTKIGAGTANGSGSVAGAEIMPFLRASSVAQVRQLMSAIDASDTNAAAKGVNLVSACRSIEAELRRNFSNRDQIGMYWAVMSDISRSIKKIHNDGMKDCVSKEMADEMHSLGLATKYLVAYDGQKPVKNCVAPKKPK